MAALSLRNNISTHLLQAIHTPLPQPFSTLTLTGRPLTKLPAGTGFSLARAVSSSQIIERLPCKPPCVLAPCQGTGWQPPLSKSLHHLNTASESEISSLQNSTAAVISVRRCKSKSLKLSINRTSCWEQLLTGASVQDMLLQLQSVVLNYEPYSSTCPIHRLY